MKVLGEMLFQSRFAKEALEREKKIVIQENHKHSSEPFRVLQELNYELVYKNTPLAERVGGTDKEIRAFTRDKIMRYLGERYQEAIVSVAGKLVGSQTRVIGLLDKYLGYKMNYGNGNNKKRDDVMRMPIYHKPRLKAVSRDFKETYVSLGFPVCALIPGLSNAKERAACDILGVILAGNMNSRLFMQLREKKQYVYTVKYFINHYEIGGELTLQCGTQQKYLKQVVSEIIEELISLIDKRKIGKKEFEEAIKYRVGELILNTEDSHEVAAFQAYQYLFLDQCRGIEDEVKVYKKLTLKEVNEVARKVFNLSKVNLAIIHNERKK